MKTVRPRSSNANAVKTGAEAASDLRNLARQVGKLGKSAESRTRSFKADSLVRNVVDSLHDDPVTSQMPAKVEQDKFRGRGVSGDLSVNDSAHRLLLVQVNRSSAAAVRDLNFVNRLRHHRLADLQVNQAAAGKEHRAHMANSLRHQPAEPVKAAQMKCVLNEKECRALTVNRRNSSAAPHLAQPTTVRDKDNRKVGNGDSQEKRHRQGRDKFLAQ